MFVKMESIPYLNFNSVIKIVVNENHPSFRIFCITKEDDHKCYGEIWKSGFETKEDAQEWLNQKMGLFNAKE